MADAEVVRSAAHDALATVIRDHADGAMLTRYVAVCEVLEQDGERAVWLMSSPDARAWDTLGMLDYARRVEQAKLVTDRLDDEDDG